MIDECKNDDCEKNQRSCNDALKIPRIANVMLRWDEVEDVANERNRDHENHSSANCQVWPAGEQYGPPKRCQRHITEPQRITNTRSRP